VATTTLEPNADTATNQWSAGGGGDHFEDVNGGDDGIKLSETTNGHEEIWEMENVPSAHSYTSEMYINFRGAKVHEGQAGTVTFYYSIDDGDNWTSMGAQALDVGWTI
jgi:hypothetical protein